MKLNEVIDLDLPSLQSIQLGWSALGGKSDKSCSLIMQGNTEMIRNDRM